MKQASLAASQLPLAREPSKGDSAGLAVFVEVEMIGAAGGASNARMQNHTSTHRPSPYKKADMVLEMRNHIKHTQTSPYEWSAGYIPLAVIAGVVMLGAAIPQ